MGHSANDRGEDHPSATREPRDQSEGQTPPDRDDVDEEALAVDALPDETRLHGEGDETEMGQRTTGSPTPEETNRTE